MRGRKGKFRLASACWKLVLSRRFYSRSIIRFSVGITLKPQMTKKHTYGLIYKITSFFFVTMSVVSVVSGLFLLYVHINYFFVGKEVAMSSVLFVIGIFLACIIWSPVAFVFMAYLLTDIDIDEKGLSLQFLWKRFSVEWGEFSSIKHIKPFGLFTNKHSYIVIVNSKLTFIHRIYGLIYSGAYRPAILIHRNIRDYDILIKDISVKVKKNLKKQ
jgi:hypothetical protein